MIEIVMKIFHQNFKYFMKILPQVCKNFLKDAMQALDVQLGHDNSLRLLIPKHYDWTYIKILKKFNVWKFI